VPSNWYPLGEDLSAEVLRVLWGIEHIRREFVPMGQIGWQWFGSAGYNFAELW
jgi:hypothetical protein